MLTVRRLLFVFGPLTVATVGACLVFDGLKATDEGGAADAAQDRTVQNDGQVGDVAPGDGQGGDAAPGDAQPVEDVQGIDAPGSDTSKPPSDGGSKGNGVVCNEQSSGAGEMFCEGGKDHKCCAHKDPPPDAPWTYPTPPCGPDCAHAGMGVGYYDYECDDIEDCDAGDICCAFGASATPFANSACMTKAKCASNVANVELCQLGRGKCSNKSTCNKATSASLPPGYYWCQ